MLTVHDLIEQLKALPENAVVCGALGEKKDNKTVQVSLYSAKGVRLGWSGLPIAEIILDGLREARRDEKTEEWLEANGVRGANVKAGPVTPSWEDVHCKRCGSVTCVTCPT